MRFTAGQYEKAIDALERGREQLVPDGLPCAICEDDVHIAYECPHNPLRAMALCQAIYERATGLKQGLEEVMGCNSMARAGWRTFLPEPQLPEEPGHGR